MIMKDACLIDIESVLPGLTVSLIDAKIYIYGAKFVGFLEWEFLRWMTCKYLHLSSMYGHWILFSVPVKNDGG